jgi:hypothetical protein
MNTYRIQANAIDTTYKANNEEEALELYAKDAGYSSYQSLVDQFGEVDSIEEK